MLSSIVEGVLELLLRFIVETVLFYTGEVVMWTVTLGYKKPRWDLYLDERPVVWVLFTEFSVWVGLCFWFAVVVLLVKLFS